MKEDFKTCYLCGTDSSKFSFIKYKYKIDKCENCGLYSSSLKTNYEIFLKNYYYEGYFKGDKRIIAYADYGKDKQTIQRNMKRYLIKITSFKNSGIILDIGCAYGFFLELAEKAGFKPHGIEVSKYAADIAKKKFGKNISHKSLSKADLKKNYFDVITMFDILEHLQTPREDLIKIRQSLKNDGLLIIQTGDSGSFWAKLAGHKWHFFAPPNHLFFFSQSTIKILLKQAGLKIIKVEKDGKWISLRYLAQLLLNDRNSPLKKFFINILNNNFFGKFPIFIRLNDNMIIYAVKD